MAQSLDRLAEEGLRSGAVAEERGGPSSDAERPVGAAGACSFIELAEGVTSGIPRVASDTRLDQLDKRPAEKAEIFVRACAMRSYQSILVAAEAVEQEGGRVVGQTDRSSLPPGCRSLKARFDRTQGCNLLTAPSGEHQRRILEWRVPGCDADRVSLLDQSRRLGELAGMQMNAGAVRQRDRKDGKRAVSTRETQRATGQLVPRLVVPQFSREGLPRYAQEVRSQRTSSPSGPSPPASECSACLSAGNASPNGLVKRSTRPSRRRSSGRGGRGPDGAVLAASTRAASVRLPHGRRR